MNNNVANFKGKIITTPKITHSIMNENFYEYTLEVKRQSGTSDFVPITMSEKLGNFKIEQFVEIKGNVRTFNKITDGKSKLIITVFAKEVLLLDSEEYENSVELQGFLCKQSIIRQTPLTERKIADVLIAVNGRNNRSYYVPTICWNRDCDFISKQPVGTELKMQGRLQSREYEKLLENGEKEIRCAIELCCKTINKIEKGD